MWSFRTKFNKAYFPMAFSHERVYIYTLILKWNSNTFYDYSTNFLWGWKGGGNKCATGSFPPNSENLLFFLINFSQGANKNSMSCLRFPSGFSLNFEFFTHRVSYETPRPYHEPLCEFPGPLNRPLEGLIEKVFDPCCQPCYQTIGVS